MFCRFRDFITLFVKFSFNEKFKYLVLFEVNFIMVKDCLSEKPSQGFETFVNSFIRTSIKFHFNEEKNIKEVKL